MECKYIKCHTECVVRQCIDEVKGDPEEICEWCEKGICIVETAKINGGMSLEAIGVIFGVTRERIRQIEERALEKLRKSKDLKKMFEAVKGLSEEPQDHFEVGYNS